MVYQWKTIAGIKADPQAAGAQFKELEGTVGLTAENVLEANRAENAPLHDEFEWNDGIAAEKYRVQQAGQLIRMLCVKADGTEHIGASVRAFFKTADSQPYESIEVILSNPDKHAELLDRALRELTAFRNKYIALTELQPLFESIAELWRDAAHDTRGSKEAARAVSQNS